MPTDRLRLAVLALSLGTFTAGVVGCTTEASSADDTGDGSAPAPTDASTTSPARDARAASDAGDAGPAPQADANDVSVYLGQIARLDGSGSTPDATLAWTFESVPPESAITIGDLQGASGPAPTFAPDKAGDYRLSLTVTSHGESRAKSVAVHVVEAPIFYGDIRLDGGGGASLGFGAVSASGKSAHSVVCGDASNGDGLLLEIAVLRALYASDAWEAPAGLDSRLAYAADGTNADGGAVSRLWTVTSATSCDTPPKLLDEWTPAAQGAGHYKLKVSPDGSRVAYVVVDDSFAQVRTVGVDGSPPHQVAPYTANADGSPQLDASINSIQQPPLRWDGSRVAWANLEIGDGSRFQIVSADDQNDATPSVLMRCSGSLRTFDLLPNGDVLAAFQAASDAGGTRPFDLVVLRPDAVTKECTLVRNLTTLADGSIVHAAALSPDRSRVAYIVSDSAVDAGAAPDRARLAIAPVDGSSPPTVVSGVPSGVGFALLFEGVDFRALRWVAGGTSLTFHLPQDVDAGGDKPLPNVVVVSADGGDLHAVAQSDVAAGRIVGAVGACSFSRGPGSAAMALAGLGALVALVARRRRR